MVNKRSDDDDDDPEDCMMLLDLLVISLLDSLIRTGYPDIDVPFHKSPMINKLKFPIKVIVCFPQQVLPLSISFVRD